MMPVWYNCPFVPAELISACGLSSRRFDADAGDFCAAQTEGICFAVEAFLTGMKKQTPPYAVIFTTLCDQMRRAFDLYQANGGKNGFLLNVPVTTGPDAISLFAEELRQMKQFLCRLSGHAARFNTIHTDAPISQGSKPHKNNRAKIALTGGPVYACQLAALEHSLGSRGTIVLNATENAVEQFRRALNPEAMKTDPYVELAAAYLQTIPSIRTRPGHLFYQWLETQLQTTAVDGIILIRHPFCDHWRGVEHQLRQRPLPPVLAIEWNGSPQAAALSRLEAFLEMLGQ
ncbi:MAG TPA: 2-hydroxyacyl-CoA dehydratase family protein [Anaerohalosphaeraceae bacterium]|nr:2-hydroxyacyl-CoA dehydratase family protein [Anaerohalosphaeraceae bacterium]